MQKQMRMLVIENFGTCNMRCAYCFPEHMWQRQGHHGAMSEETYRGILERTLAVTDAPVIDIHLAGGEPLLAGRAWLEMAFRVGREIAAQYGKQVTFSLQTNATFLTYELAQYLIDNHVNVGVSLDGPPELNEEVRGHTQDTLAGFAILREAQGRPPGVIVTVTRCNALRMNEVVAYLDSLCVALFRANQMGATASWNTHAAPHAEEWLAARQMIFEEIVARRGRILEFNLDASVKKFVRSLLEEIAPFQFDGSCCDMRCSAGRQLMYFDRQGQGYPCPRANVTPEARIGHYASPNFDQQWDQSITVLDAAMVVPTECRQCPAQFICDYGCHAFNVAQGNFFQVNCDATKDLFGWFTERLDDVARIYLYSAWRNQLKKVDDFAALQQGISLPETLVTGLANELRKRLADRLIQPDLTPAILASRYGWQDDLVPMAVLDRPRVASAKGSHR